MKNVISFSLWGDNPKYTVGAVRNAELAKIVYPGWVARFYVGTSVPNEIVNQLQSEGAEVVLMNRPGNWTGMFWRFSAIADSDVDAMISRDTDSRLSNREASAVSEWLSSENLFHIMRDHPEHNAPILGGMWGARKPILQDMNHLIDSYTAGDFWQVDQNFLRDVIYPRVRQTSIVHDEFFQKHSFPTHRVGLEFVGQIFDENEVTVPEHEQLLAHSLEIK